MENMNKPVYKITVEIIDQGGQATVSDELRCGMECNGFALIALQGDGSTVAIQNTNIMALAESFSHEGMLCAAAHLGNAIREANEMAAKAERDKALHGALGEIFGKLMKDKVSET